MRAIHTAVRLLLISDNRSRIFFGLKSYGKEGNLYGNKPRWIVTGGKVHEKETPVEATIFTANQGLGIKIKPENLTLFAVKDDPSFNTKWMFYICSTWEGEFSADKLSSFEDTRWVASHQLRELRSQEVRMGTFLEEAATLYFSKYQTEETPSGYVL